MKRKSRVNFQSTIVYLENAWNSNQMITEGKAAIPLETTRRAFGNKEKSKQRSAIAENTEICILLLLHPYVGTTIKKLDIH